MNKILAYLQTDYSSIDWKSVSEMVPNMLGNFTIKTKYGAMAATTTPILVFGSVYIAWAYMSRAWRRCKGKKPRRVLSRSMSLGALRGGNLALQRLNMYHEARANHEKLENDECQLRILLEDDTPDFWKLQTIISRLEMGGKEEQAVNILKKSLRKTDEEGRVHEAYEIEMSLVEMLIYKGDFSEAFKCNCLKDELDEKISDARRPLYKAIIHIMLNHEDNKVKECWEKFSDIREHFHCPPSWQEMHESGIQIHDLSSNFVEFKKVVQTLKDDIKKANEKKLKK